MMRELLRPTALLLCILSSAAWAAPTVSSVQGRVVDADGMPLAGARAWRIQFFDSAEGGAALGGAIAGTVAVSATGRFTIELSAPGAVLAAADVWYEIGIDGATPPDGKVDPEDQFPGRAHWTAALFARRLTHDGPGSGLDADSVDGLEGSALATRAELAQGLASTAPAGHSHQLGELGGRLSLSQMADSIAFGTAADSERLGGLQPSAFEQITSGVINLSGAGTPVANGARLLAALGSAAATSQTTRTLLRLGPGLFDLAGAQLVMKSAVDIAGASRDSTTIRSSVTGWIKPMVVGAENSELRDLTIENLCGAGAEGASGLISIGGSTDLRRARVRVTSESAGYEIIGIAQVQDSLCTIEDCIVELAGPKQGASQSRLIGVKLEYLQHAELRRIRITGEGSPRSQFHGIYGGNGGGDIAVSDSSIESIDGRFDKAVGIMKNVAGGLQVTRCSIDIDLTSAPSPTQLDGILVENTTGAVSIEETTVRIAAKNPLGTAVRATGCSMPVDIHRARITSGATACSATNATLRIAQSQVVGALVGVEKIVQCYDGSFDPVPDQ